MVDTLIVATLTVIKYVYNITGGAVGSVEGCFLNPIPGSTTPMLMRTLGLMARRSILYGKSTMEWVYSTF